MAHDKNPLCFVLVALILSPACAHRPPTPTPVGSSLALEITPLGYWCDREGEVVIAIRNRSGHPVRFGVGRPAKVQAEWVGTYSYEFRNAKGGEIQTTHHGIISCTACKALVGGVCPDNAFPVELDVDGMIAWRADVADAPVEKTPLIMDLEVPIVPLGGLIPDERMVTLKGSVLLDTVKSDESCWQVRRRPTSR